MEAYYFITLCYIIVQEFNFIGGIIKLWPNMKLLENFQAMSSDLSECISMNLRTSAKWKHPINMAVEIKAHQGFVSQIEFSSDCMVFMSKFDTIFNSMLYDFLLL